MSKTEFMLFFSSQLHLLNMTNGVANPRADTIRLRGKGEKLTPMDIKVFEPMRQKTDGMKSAACAKNNGGCSHLCLAAENSLGFVQ